MKTIYSNEIWQYLFMATYLEIGNLSQFVATLLRPFGFFATITYLAFQIFHYAWWMLFQYVYIFIWAVNDRFAYFLDMFI